MSGDRFIIDHGTIHDLRLGRHVRTDPDFGPGRKFEEDGIEQCCSLLNELQSRIASAEGVISYTRGYLNASDDDVSKYRRAKLAEVLEIHEATFQSLPAYELPY